MAANTSHQLSWSAECGKYIIFRRSDEGGGVAKIATVMRVIIVQLMETFTHRLATTGIGWIYPNKISSLKRIC